MEKMKKPKGHFVLLCNRLVDDKSDLILLFEPPFDKTSLDPGYIKDMCPEFVKTGGNTRMRQCG